MTDEARRDRGTLRRASPRVRRRRVIAAIIGALLFTGLVAGSIVLFAPHPQEVPVAESPSPTPSSTPEPTASATPLPDAPLKLTFDRRRFSIDDPASIWAVVNKQRPLQPQDYAPVDLVGLSFIDGGQMLSEAAAQVEALAAQFTAETGQSFRTVSSYRSYGRQVDVYNGWVSRLGQEAADLLRDRRLPRAHQPDQHEMTRLLRHICGEMAVIGLGIPEKRQGVTGRRRTRGGCA